MKRYIKADEVNQLRGKMFKVKNIEEGRKCGACKRKLEIFGEEGHLGMIVVEGGTKVICQDCVDYYEGSGVHNIEYDIERMEEKGQKLKEEYNKLVEELGYENNIEQFGGSIIKLEIEVAKYRGELAELQRKEKLISNVDTSEWEPMESYLIEQYDVIEDKNYLKHPLQIEEYFKDMYYDFFECGQGYYEDQVNVIVRIGERFYEVQLTADVWSQKQDRGDRLYWVENLESVKYKEIVKPERKEEFKYIKVGEKDYDKLMDVIKKSGIEIELVGKVK